MRLLTNLYIDGFNLYYRALKDTPFRWLNLYILAQVLFPEDTIGKVSYFTSLIVSRPNNPAQSERQQTYLRALETIDGIEIHYGTFRPRTKVRPLAEPIPGLPEYVRIRDSEEKGSDVNLATRLLVDGFNGEYEQAVIVSNDADLATPMRYVRDELGLRATVVNPDSNNITHVDLQEASTRIKRLWRSHLRRSQLPDSVFDERGEITKPTAW